MRFSIVDIFNFKILFVWLVQFFEFLACITVSLVYKTRVSKLYVCSEYKMHTKSFGAMVLRTSNQPFLFFLSKYSQLVHIVVENVCHPTDKEKTKSCP